MPQVFSRRANGIGRLLVFGFIPVLFIVLGIGMFVARSPVVTGVGRAVPQPVPFSHAQHAGGLGIDCRYCHSTVETGASAGMPPTETCMDCHAEILKNADVLSPVRESWESGEPLRWRRVHDLADFVYFDHGIHVSRGVACETCHGRVDRMARMRQVHSLRMDWCLACHRRPEPRLRPRDAVFRMGWQAPADRDASDVRLAGHYGIDTTALSDCSICHR